MEPQELVGRVTSRYLEGEEVPPDEAIIEMLATALDRIEIRLGFPDEVPKAAASIAVEAAVKALRLRGFEGSTSESASEGGSVSNSFIDDVLDAYTADFDAMRRAVGRAGIKFFK